MAILLPFSCSQAWYSKGLCIISIYGPIADRLPPRRHTHRKLIWRKENGTSLKQVLNRLCRTERYSTKICLNEEPMWEWDLFFLAFFCLFVSFLKRKSVQVNLRQIDLVCFPVSCLFSPKMVHKVSNVHLKSYGFILLQRKQFRGGKSIYFHMWKS